MPNEHLPYTYTAADIEKYWKGQLSAAEQHAMEKAAQEDPFLADAMEGYEKNALASQTVSTDISDLRARLAARTNEKEKSKLLPFAWWKVAAVIVVVVGAAWLYSGIGTHSKDAAIAKKTVIENQLPKPVIPPGNNPPPADTTTNVAPEDVAVNKRTRPAAKNKSIAADENETRATDTVRESLALTEPSARSEDKMFFAQPDSLKDRKEVYANAETLKKDIPGITSSAPERKAEGFWADGETYKKRGKPVAARANGFTNTFNGNLMDASNKPVANAFIQIPRLNVATQTDNKGFFSFKAKDTALSVSLESQGFASQNFHLSNKVTLNQIVLKPVAPNQADVVTQSNGAEKVQRPAVQEITITIPDAEPVVGWDAYKEYLEKNKKITNYNLQNIHGSVVVSFDVHQKWIGNYTIEQSLDEELDAEAIRLIKNGPAWKLLKGKKTTATVIVRF